MMMLLAVGAEQKQFRKARKPGDEQNDIEEEKEQWGEDDSQGHGNKWMVKPRHVYDDRF